LVMREWTNIVVEMSLSRVYRISITLPSKTYI
jgi:hypothetical protein